MFCIHCGVENIEGARFCVACGKNVQASRPGSPGHGNYNGGETEMGLIPGQVLANRFEIKELLGAGGMGCVYLARDRVLERPVAIKVLREVLSRDTGSVRRLVEEAKASIRLAHPNIVRVDDYHDAGTLKFLAMEYVEGETLADRIAREPKLSDDEVRHIAVAICAGLEHAHTKKVIHRDLKPGNILIAKGGAVKIADFGIARVARDSVSRLTSQQDSGTLLYMAPEQLLGKSGETSDIYSLGVVLYEMLSGDPPFTSGDIPYQIRELAPASLRGVSPSLARTIMKCLEKDPTARFPTVVELRAELQTKSEDRRAAASKRQAEVKAGKEADSKVGAPKFTPDPESPRPTAGNAAPVSRSSSLLPVLKFAVLGALGFGGIAIPAAIFILEAVRADRPLYVIVWAVVSGLLGPLLLRLPRRAKIWFGLAFLAIGIAGAMAIREYSSGDVEDAVPILAILFVLGGGLFGAIIGRRAAQGSHPGL